MHFVHRAVERRAVNNRAAPLPAVGHRHHLVNQRQLLRLQFLRRRPMHERAQERPAVNAVQPLHKRLYLLQRENEAVLQVQVLYLLHRLHRVRPLVHLPPVGSLLLRPLQFLPKSRRLLRAQHVSQRAKLVSIKLHKCLLFLKIVKVFLYLPSPRATRPWPQCPRQDTRRLSAKVLKNKITSKQKAKKKNKKFRGESDTKKKTPILFALFSIFCNFGG